MILKKILTIGLLALNIIACSNFKAKRVGGEESDRLAMQVTDKWVNADTIGSIRSLLKDLDKHKGFKKYIKGLGRTPKLFIGEIQNDTSDPYFPIDDFNDELLNEFSSTGDYILIESNARKSVMKEIQYQNDGTVDSRDIKVVGKSAGADIIIFGSIRMKPHTRNGKTIKEYSVNIRMTDIERGIEVLRVRAKVQKYSEQNGYGW